MCYVFILYFLTITCICTYVFYGFYIIRDRKAQVVLCVSLKRTYAVFGYTLDYRKEYQCGSGIEFME